MSSNILILKNQFINKNAPLQNGLGRFIPQLARLTIKFCKAGGSSNGVRQFIEEDITNFAKTNPGVVVYLKPRRHRSPVIVAEYLNGERHWQSLHNKSLDEVAGWVDFYKNHSGREYSDQFKNTYSDYPSIQGIWNAHTNSDPYLRQPSGLQSRPRRYRETSASEMLQQIFNSQKTPGETEQLEKSKQGEKSSATS